MSQDASYAPQAVLADEQAEQAILGVLLQRSEALRDSTHTLLPDDFYYEKHRHIFAAIHTLDDARTPVDTITVTSHLEKQGVLKAVGGPQYLVRLRSDSPLVTNVASYIDIVKDYSLRRMVVAASRETMRTISESPEDATSIADEAVATFTSLALTGSRSSVVQLQEPLGTLIRRIEEQSTQGLSGGITGTPSGFHVIDDYTNGWQKGDLIILAARPGMGKTALALNLIVNAATDTRSPKPGIIFSLEMGAEQLAGRILSSMARVPSTNMRSADLSDKQFNQIYESIGKLKDLPIFIDETPSITVSEMARKCRQVKHEHGLGLIIIDYLQLMTGSANARISNREQEISEISRRLKALARELECPVIALSQLNRAVEQRPDKRPMLSDLRESGAIEQDADIIIFLYRQIYYDRLTNKENEEGGGEGGGGGGGPHLEMMPSREGDDAEVIIAKHRSGATGRVMLTFHESFTLFANRMGDSPPTHDDDDLVGSPTAGFDPDTDFGPPPSDDDFGVGMASDDDMPI